MLFVNFTFQSAVQIIRSVPGKDKGEARRLSRKLRQEDSVPFRTIIIFACLVFGMQVMGASYYVDFSAGSDANNGTSTSTAWQHCPGDSHAAGTAASTAINAGDSINLKGGVVYSGNIALARNGSDGNPMVVQTASGWGSGRAIISGGFTNCWIINPSGDYHVYSGLFIT